MTSPLVPFEEALAKSAAESQGLSPEDAAALRGQIRAPDRGHGDLALPCFIAKKLKKNPAEMATAIAQAIAGDDNWASVEAVGPYVNVTFSLQKVAQAVVPAARLENYGRGIEGDGKTVVIDFSSPNIAKPLAFHHIRSTVVGAAISRLHETRGWNVVGINYLGDWGKQFGLLATGFGRNGDPARRADAKHLVEVYVKSNAEADVGGRKAAIAAPEEAKKLAKLLEETRAKAGGDGDAKEKKKATKSVKSIERKLRTMFEVGPPVDPLADFDDHLASLEARAAKAQSTLADAEAKDREARMFLKAMEDGDAKALATWREFRETSIEEFKRVYDRMGISFTSIEGESRYGDALEGALERVRAKPGTRIDQGAEVVDMPAKKGEPPAILKTRDGTALYLTRDIAAAMDRYDRFAFDRSLYVVAADQALHFRLLFQTLDEMGFDWASRCEHVPFGRVHGMSTRRGNIVFLDEVLDESTRTARTICETSEKLDRSRLDKTVEAIGVGAVTFGDLKSLRTSDYDFGWEDVLNFSGHTAPYVQFSHARACSIIEKGGGVPSEANPELLTVPEEQALIVALGKYPTAIAEACDAYEPSMVTRALIEIAQKTASYLTAGNRERSMRVLVEDDADRRAARLWLIDGVRNVLAHGLGLLGVHAPPSM